MNHSRFGHRWQRWLAWMFAMSILGMGCEPSPAITPTTWPAPTHTATVLPATATPTTPPSPTPTAVPATPTPTATASPTLQPTATLPLPATLLPTTTVSPNWLQKQVIFYKTSDEVPARRWEEIRCINADGSGEKRLFHYELDPTQALPDRTDPGPAQRPQITSLALSPDKTTIACATAIWESGSIGPAGSPALWLIYTNGSSPRQVLSFPNSGRLQYREIRRIRWSPDGTHLAFTLLNPNRFVDQQVCIVNLDDGTSRSLGQSGYAAWLPHDKRISYILWEWDQGKRDYVPSFCILDLEPQLWQPACSPLEWAGFNNGYDWSPDGNRLAISLEGDGIYIRSGSATELSRLVKDGNTYSPVVHWSPDGHMIAYFTRSQPTSFALRVVDAQDGRTRIEIAGVALGGTWSPDSQMLVIRTLGADGSICVVSVSGSQVWKVPNTEQAFMPTW